MQAKSCKSGMIMEIFPRYFNMALRDDQAKQNSLIPQTTGMGKCL